MRRLKVLVEADGGSRGNPGVAGYGAVVLEAVTGEVLVERAAPIGVATNNIAEYSGLIAGLQAAADLGAVDVEVRMDSKLVVEQMSGRWQIRNPGLRPLAAQAAALVKRFDTVRFVWIPRERNRRADALANAAMDGAQVEPVGVDTSSGSVAGVDAGSGVVSGFGAPVRRWQPSGAVASTRLVLLRHGETAMTRERRFCGRSDVALTDLGLAQAQAAAGRVGQFAAGASVVITSPLSRCRATADVVAAGLAGVPVREDADLIECDFGEWDGLTFAEVLAGWPDRYEKWLASTSVTAPGGESFDAVTRRIRSCVSRLLAQCRGERLVMVSHVTPIKLILRDALAAGGDAFLHRLHLDPGGICVVDAMVDGGVSVRTVNDTSHLSDLRG